MLLIAKITTVCKSGSFYFPLEIGALGVDCAFTDAFSITEVE